jgi:potassium/hydrogen antiporter
LSNHAFSSGLDWSVLVLGAGTDWPKPVEIGPTRQSIFSICRMTPGVDLLGFFVLQMGVGAAAGLAVGWLAVRLINRINLEASGLYPVLTGVCGMLAFGTATSLNGSGFLAIYLAGIVIGNSRVIFQRGTFLFHDGIAWVGQIVMFVMLGLLSFPSELMAVAGPGLLIAAVLILIARPVGVVPLLLPFGFNVREMVFLSWVGLKGAVPIILATYPLLFGLPGGGLLFNVVFFVVLVSAVTQGWSLPTVARLLGLQRESLPEAPVSLEITSLRDVDADIVEYTLTEDSRASDRRLNQLALPDGVVVAIIARGETLIPPRGSTSMCVGDHVFVVLRPEVRPLVDRVFSRESRTRDALPSLVEFPLRGWTTVADLSEFYGIELGAPAESTLDELIRGRLGDDVERGRMLEVGEITLHVREVVDGKVTAIGLAITSTEPDATPVPVPGADGSGRRNE